MFTVIQEMFNDIVVYPAMIWSAIIAIPVALATALIATVYGTYRAAKAAVNVTKKIKAWRTSS